MSIVANDVTPVSPGIEAFIDGSKLGRFDRFVAFLSDKQNPILVKETRQALKSRQFTISFWLVLLFATGWSYFGITMQLPQIYYLPSGAPMLVGYYIILCVPLLLIVPFSAYRSLAAERDDGTYELLSITALSARQIVTGKLGSAIMQILVYYAALAPCIGFTYLLRGIDIGMIFFLLVGTFAMSVLLCTLGLVFAGTSSSRPWQALMSVVLLVILLAIGIPWVALMLSLVLDNSTGAFIYTHDFRIIVGFVGTMYVTILVMLVFLAAAQNSFVTDNRSTKLRTIMLVQQLCLTGWMTYLWLDRGDQLVDDFPSLLPTISAMIWIVYGAIMSGEIAELSPRARRELPHSFFGRTFLTWFNPGASTGYAFASSTLLAVMLFTFGSNVLAATAKPKVSMNYFELGRHCLLLWSYATLYLGLGRIMVLLLRRTYDFGLASAVMLNALVLVLGAAVPFFVGFAVNDFQSINYSELQVFNWVWTLSETTDKSGILPFVIPGIKLAVPVAGVVASAALFVLVINLGLAGREVEATRLATPDRVLTDKTD